MKINNLKTEQQIITVTKKAISSDVLGTKSKTVKLNKMIKIMSLASVILIFLLVLVKKFLLKFKVKGVAIIEIKKRKNWKQIIHKSYSASAILLININEIKRGKIFSNITPIVVKNKVLLNFKIYYFFVFIILICRGVPFNTSLLKIFPNASL